MCFRITSSKLVAEDLQEDASSAGSFSSLSVIGTSLSSLLSKVSKSTNHCARSHLPCRSFCSTEWPRPLPLSALQSYHVAFCFVACPRAWHVKCHISSSLYLGMSVSSQSSLLNQGCEHVELRENDRFIHSIFVHPASYPACYMYYVHVVDRRFFAQKCCNQ